MIDPLTAPYVLEVFKRYDEGTTMTDTRSWLNGQGIKNAKGQQMTYNSIDFILKNRRYRARFRSDLGPFALERLTNGVGD